MHGGALISRIISRCIISILPLFFLSCHKSGSQPVEITFWAMGAEGEHIKSLLPQFERLNPGIRVKVQAIPWGAAHEKLLTAFAGNSTPDLCQLGNTWIPEFQALDALYPLDSLIAGSEVIHPQAFFEGIWNTNMINGKVLGVPWYVDTRVLFYRKDVLEALGYPHPPQTWAEWLEISQKIKAAAANSETRYANFFSLIYNDWQVPAILMISNGGKLLRDNYCYGAFDEPANREALKFYLDFFQEGLAPRTMTEFVNIYQGFASATFAMTITGPWNVNEIRKRSPEIEGKWSTAPMPRALNRNSVAGGASLVIFKNSPYPGAAWRFIEFLATAETQVEFFRITRDLPAVRRAWEAPELRNDPEARAFFQQLEAVQPTPPIPEWEQIAVKIQEHLEKAVYGQATLDEAIAQLNREVDRILEKRRWLISNNLITSAEE